ncbi:MAG: class I SAM-dependent methyltransferase [Desulfobacteraceae bacterium]|nr:MAG: class I SAM-dependent methyltransferase [Desulfobacteraceae bacterium]
MDTRVNDAALCPVCFSSGAAILRTYRGKHPLFSAIEIARCLSCGMVFALPMPDSALLESYNSAYFESAHGGLSSDGQASAFFSAIARLRVAHLERYLDTVGIAPATVLEFGPGAGLFARSLLDRYPDISYNACETDVSLHGELRKMGIHLWEMSALKGDCNDFDLVVMSHVLEHVPNPVEFLQSVARNLAQGGVLFIEVPCRDFEYKELDEPHLLFFDKISLQFLLGRLGFHDTQITYHGQEIERLRHTSFFRNKLMALRSRLINMGLVAPFARIQPGMEMLTDPMERASVAPFYAHRESEKPAWWLRALARKKPGP